MLMNYFILPLITKKYMEQVRLQKGFLLVPEQPQDRHLVIGVAVALFLERLLPRRQREGGADGCDDEKTARRHEGGHFLNVGRSSRGLALQVAKAPINNAILE